MKKFLFILSVSVCTIVFSQSNEETQFQSIVENLFQQVFSDLETDKIPDYLTDDFLLFENGEIWNTDSIRIYTEQLKKQFNNEENKMNSFKRTNSFKFIKSESDAQSGTIYYENFADFTMNGTSIAKMHWLESAVFRKTKDGWKISFLHSSPVKEDKN